MTFGVVVYDIWCCCVWHLVLLCMTFGVVVYDIWCCYWDC